jgi:hypothetical protein
MHASDACAVLSKAYGGEVMKESSIFEWHEHFKEGHKNTDDDERSGCPKSYRTNENAEKVQNLMHSDRRSSINQAYYVDILKWLCEAVCGKRPKLGLMIGFSTMTMLQLTRNLIEQFLAQKSITEIEHPPYSSDLAPNDLWMFPKIKSILKG